jgi:hypothetical protein
MTRGRAQTKQIRLRTVGAPPADQIRTFDDKAERCRSARQSRAPPKSMSADERRT